MKKLFFLLLFAAAASYVSYSQKIPADKVPAAVRSAFSARFPAVTKVNWEMENVKEYEAGFKMNGEEMSANFDNSGQWLETETEIKISDLPLSIRSAVSRDFAGYKIKEASRVERANNGTCYEAEIEKNGEAYDVLFAPDATIISKTKLGKEKDEKD